MGKLMVHHSSWNIFFVGIPPAIVAAGKKLGEVTWVAIILYFTQIIEPRQWWSEPENDTAQKELLFV